MENQFICSFHLHPGYSDLKMVISDNLELDDILQRDFTTIFRPGYINVEGVTLPERFSELKQPIFDLEVSENDVWVCSFPKTGKRFIVEIEWFNFMYVEDFI